MKKINWLKLVNVLLLQWLFIRLTRCNIKKVVKLSVMEASMVMGGGISIGGNGKIEQFEWYSIQGFIIPLTGWWTPMKSVSKERFFIKVTKQYKIKK